MNETFQGWSNRETWTLNFWLTNEVKHYAEFRRRLREPDPAQTIRNYAEATMMGTRLVSGWLADALTCVFERVNWEEIVKNHEED